MNLGFMVDGSAAVELSGQGNFNKSLAFVANLIGYFDISKNATNPGMVVFSEDPHLVFNFSTPNNPTDAMAAVKMAPYPNRGRKIGKALNFVRQDLFSESEAGNQTLKANYLIVLTSGASYDQVKTPAELLQEKNVTVFSIGIGNNYDVDQLKLVSGDNGTRVYKTSYQHLGDLKKKLKKAICLCKLFLSTFTLPIAWLLSTCNSLFCSRSKVNFAGKRFVLPTKLIMFSYKPFGYYTYMSSCTL